MKYLYGIQPTGKIHIGNYLGGIKEAIKLQEKHYVEFLIADYHALTTQKRSDVDVYMLKLEEDLYRLGAKKVIFQKPENCELAFEIMCITPMGEMKRMTQFKDKGGGNVGLFVYPCLMAADIILSKPDYVICGEDQTQHIEFYHKTCKRLKIKPAKIKLTKTSRIMSIKYPTKKMSKSLGDEHCIYLFDDNNKKIMKAPTTKEGVINLKQIAKGLGIRFFEKNNKKSKQRIIEAIMDIKK